MIVYAHRGASLELPENTLEAFQRAIELGVDAVETDVHMTRDGHIVVHHDETGVRSASVNEKLAELTLAEVRGWNLAFGFRQRDGSGLVNAVFRVPTLESVLEAWPRLQLNIDIKPRSAEAVRRVVALIKSHRAEERVLLTSFYDDVVSLVREAGYLGATGLGRISVVRALSAPRRLPRSLLPPGDRIQIPMSTGPLRLDTEALISRLKHHGYAVDYWVCNDPSAARALERAGADGVMTDDPRAILGGLGRSLP